MNFLYSLIFIFFSVLLSLTYYRNFESRKEIDYQYAHLVDKFEIPKKATLFQISLYFLKSTQSMKEKNI
jgi:hypothetical protein